MKYIIEIEDEPFGRNDDPVISHGMDELYRAKGFRSLVFDSVGLKKLKPYVDPQVIIDVPAVEHQSYENGLADGWKGAAYIANKHGLRYSFFDKFDIHTVVEEMRKNLEPQIGDEVRALDDDNEVYVVTQIGMEIDHTHTYYRGIDSDGKWHSRARHKIAKTGRHFDAIDKFFEEMK